MPPTKLTKTVTVINPAENDDFAYVFGSDQETDVLIGSLAKNQGVILTKGMVGTMISVIGKVSAAAMGNKNAPVATSTEIIDNHTHEKYFEMISDLGNRDVYIRDGMHLQELLGLEKNRVGNDFGPLGGDVKYHLEKSDIHLGGRIRFDTVYNQGKMLVAAFHKPGVPLIHKGVYLNIWKDVPDSIEELRFIIDWYNKWNDGGRKKTKRKLPNFEMKYFKIILHSGPSDDRIVIKAEVVKKYGTQFYLRQNREEFSNEDLVIKQFACVGGTVNRLKTVTRISMTVRAYMKMYNSGLVKLPPCQRDDLKNKQFAVNYISETLMKNHQGTRGLFYVQADKPKNKPDEVLYWLYDGQQRTNAIIRFFNGDFALKECFALYKGELRDISNQTWPQILEASKVNKDIEDFVNEVLDRTITVNVYNGYSSAEMAEEYHKLNCGASMNAQEIRTAIVDSYFGIYARQLVGTTKDESITIEIPKDSLFTLDSKEMFTDLGITRNRMNDDSLVSFDMLRVSTWGAGHVESEKDMDKAYELSRGEIHKERIKALVLETIDTLYRPIREMIAQYKSNRSKYTNKKRKGKRIITAEHEWNLVTLFLIETKKRFGKTVSVNKDVLSVLLREYYDMAYTKLPTGKLDFDLESSFGVTFRQGEYDYTLFQEWIDKGGPLHKLFSMTEIQLKELGLNLT